MDPYTFTHLRTPISPTSPMGVGLNNLNNNMMNNNNLLSHIPTNNTNINNVIISEYFVPKLEIIDPMPRNKSSFDPPPRSNNTNTNTNNTNNNFNNINYNNPNNNTNNNKPPRPHIITPESPSSSSSSPRLLFTPTALSPPSPYEEDPNSPFFIDSYTKIRTLSGEIFQCAGDTLVRGFATDNAKIEFYAHELLKVARQLNNSNNIIDDDDKKRPTPPLVRPRRIRRKHIDEEEIDDLDKKRKIGTVSTTEMYCHSCGTTDTPEWRRGPDNCKSLCNACGLHYAKMLRRETMIPNRAPARQTMTLNNLLN